jgi:transcriptional regulator with PAS, ATPase and Fis domain
MSLDTATAVPVLPTDADGVLQLAARSMFDVLARDALGVLVVNRDHRIVWISEGYKRFLPALGVATAADFVGRPVEEVVPNTQMGAVIETGQPMLVDLLSNRAGTFLVSRLPLRDEAGEVIGALGLVLLDHPETTMQPLMHKFAKLQRELDEARAQLAAQRRPKYTIASFVGASPAAFEVKRQARRMAATEATVLLLGETGTGKELLAHAIHAASARASRPFIGINIAAVPDTLLEAEFFGVAPGAYTGADRKGRVGKFKLADGGTLFLDEIGDMPLSLQAKLLRVLQEQEVEPLGSNAIERVDVRVIAATSQDLAAMVSDGRFRADLYYRLHVLPLRLPPLRERLADLPALAEAFVEDIARRGGLPPRSLAPSALGWLARQRWPGNIRELRNVLEQALLLSDDVVLDERHFDAVRPDGTLVPEAVPAGAGASPPIVAPPSAWAASSALAAHGLGQAQSGHAPSGHASAAFAEPVLAPRPGAFAPTDPAALTMPAPPTLSQRVATLEWEAIRDALAATSGNRVAAARLLKISRATLYERLARYPDLVASAPTRRGRA